MRPNTAWWQKNWHFIFQILPVSRKNTVTICLESWKESIRCMKSRWYWIRSVHFWSKEIKRQRSIFHGIRRQLIRILRLPSFMNIIWWQSTKTVRTDRCRNRWFYTLCMEMLSIIRRLRICMQVLWPMRNRQEICIWITENRWWHLHGNSWQSAT